MRDVYNHTRPTPIMPFRWLLVAAAREREIRTIYIAASARAIDFLIWGVNAGCSGRVVHPLDSIWLTRFVISDQATRYIMSYYVKQPVADFLSALWCSILLRTKLMFLFYSYLAYIIIWRTKINILSMTRCASVKDTMFKIIIIKLWLFAAKSKLKNI